MTAEWKLRVERMPIELSVGIYPHEQRPQPVLVSLEIKGLADADPSSLDGCLDYEPLCHWLHHEWPATPHVPLLETRVNQLFAYVFALDPRIHWVQAGIYKVNMATGAQVVGIERTVTRHDFAVLQAKYTSHHPITQDASVCLN